MGSDRFDWDVKPDLRFTGQQGSLTSAHFCGGTADVAINASMPNALVSRDRLADRVLADPALSALMQQFLGCTGPVPDPVYAKH
jgi:hypothetical protein